MSIPDTESMLISRKCNVGNRFRSDVCIIHIFEYVFNDSTCLLFIFQLYPFREREKYISFETYQPCGVHHK